jgi:hypothetical protein
MFGLDVDPDQEIAELVEGTKKLSCVDASIVSLEHYETVYGIYDHLRPDPNRPLAVVAKHPAEDNGHTSALYEIFELYAKSNVYKHFGLSIREFLKYPRELTTLMIDIASKASQQATSDVEDQLRALRGVAK